MFLNFVPINFQSSYISKENEHSKKKKQPKHQIVKYNISTANKVFEKSSLYANLTTNNQYYFK